jgi:hypothetical protein
MSDSKTNKKQSKDTDKLKNKVKNKQSKDVKPKSLPHLILSHQI